MHEIPDPIHNLREDFVSRATQTNGLKCFNVFGLTILGIRHEKLSFMFLGIC